MREKLQLLSFVKQYPNETLTLVTVTETEGSTYRKAGARKVIAPDGKSCGLISGGCLEKEIVQFALNMQEERATHLIDSTGELDRMYGYSLGCQGKLFLQFEKLSSSVLIQNDYLGLDESEKIQLYVFGAGPDIDPLHELIKWTQWPINFYTQNIDLYKERLSSGWNINFVNPPGKITIDNRKSAVLLFMSHDYNFDLDILSQIYHPDIPYIGILGPQKKKNLLIDDLKKIHSIKDIRENHFFGPMGIDHLGRGESAIALSIVAQIQSLFFSKDNH